MPPETHSELIPPARKIEFESCEYLKKRSDSELSKKKGGIIRPRVFFFETLRANSSGGFQGPQTFFGFFSTRFISISLFMFSFIFSLLFHLVSSSIFDLFSHFLFHLFSTALLSSLSSSLAFSSCLVFSRLVLSPLSLSLFLCLLSLSLFLCLLSLSLSLSVPVCLSLSLSVPVSMCCCGGCCVVCVTLWSWCVRVVCGTLKTPCELQNVPVCTGTTPAWNVHTGGVLNVHTGRCVCGRGEGRGRRVSVTHQQHTQRTTNKRTTHNTEHAKWHRQFRFPKFAHVRLSLDPQRFTKETLGSYTFSCWRIDREQHVPDSSNHSLYLTKLFSFSNLEGSSGGNQQPDGSISLSPSPPLPSSTTTTHNTKQTGGERQRLRHRDRDTETQRDRDRETETQTKPKFNERFCTSDTSHDVRLKESLTFHNGFMFLQRPLIKNIFLKMCFRQSSMTPQHHIIVLATFSPCHNSKN